MPARVQPEAQVPDGRHRRVVLGKRARFEHGALDTAAARKFPERAERGSRARGFAGSRERSRHRGEKAPSQLVAQRLPAAVVERPPIRTREPANPRTATTIHPMYSATLLLHSWLRWAVILFGLIAIWRAIDGVRSRRAWLPGDDRFCRIFLGVLDLQMLLGLLLYFVFSPLTKAALGDFAGAMKDPLMRFWAVEHVFGMIIGVALAHVGMSRARRAATDTHAAPARRGLLHPGAPRDPRGHSVAGPAVRPAAFQVVVR